MTGLDLVMVFAVILFARLGVRLVTRYIKMKGENDVDGPDDGDDGDDAVENNDEETGQKD